MQLICSCACINVLSMAKQGSIMMLIQGLKNMFNHLACFNINKPVAKLKCENEVKTKFHFAVVLCLLQCRHVVMMKADWDHIFQCGS